MSVTRGDAHAGRVNVDDGNSVGDKNFMPLQGRLFPHSSMYSSSDNLPTASPRARATQHSVQAVVGDDCPPSATS
jgi:hypothetical protein